MISRFKTYYLFKRPSGFILLLLVAVTMLLSSCYEMTVQVDKVPENTPVDDPIYIVGNFNNWDPGDTRYILQRTPDSVYEVNLPRGIGPLEYKFTRGDWTTVEKSLCGFEIENRVLFYGKTDLVVDTIASWNDLAPVDCPHVTLVIDDLPSNTPENSKLAVAGTFNNWDPNQQDWQFQYDSTLDKPVLNLPRVGGNRTIDLLVTRGSLDRVESDIMGREIAPRRIVFGDQDTIHLKIEGWEDLGESKSNRLTIILDTIPNYTPPNDPIYIVGDFNGWYPRQGDYQLEKNQQGHYFINMPKKWSKIECKFTRGGWSTEEVDRWGYKIANRVIYFNEDTVHISINNWRDFVKPEDSPIRIILEKVPASTPADGQLFIAGNFNNWNPSDNAYSFHKAADGTYYIDIPRSEYILSFKVTRGYNWSTVECQLNGEDIQNRDYAYKDVSVIRISVAAWKDLGP